MTFAPLYLLGAFIGRSDIDFSFYIVRLDKADSYIPVSGEMFCIPFFTLAGTSVPITFFLNIWSGFGAGLCSLKDFSSTA